MAMFWKNPTEKLADEPEALRKRATQLAAKRTTAQADLNRAIAAREKHHLEGDLDDDKFDAKLQAAVDSAASSLAGYDESVAKQATLVAEAEARLQAERNAAAQKAAGEADRADRGRRAKWLSLSREFAALLEKLPQPKARRWRISSEATPARSKPQR
jgi:hypothetical protein